jgi:hypothetical protein
MQMNKIISAVMIVVGVGAMVFGFSHYTPAGDYAGWPASCGYIMTAGAMLATGGRLLS